MLSALPHASISSDTTPQRAESPTKKNSSNVKSEPEAIAPLPQDHYNEPGGLVRGAPQDSYDDTMDYANEAPIHPLASAPLPSSLSSAPTRAQPQPSGSHLLSSYPPQQHQQLLKLKTEHGFSTTPQLNHHASDMAMLGEMGDESAMDQDHPTPERQASVDDYDEDDLQRPQHYPTSASPQEKGHLVVDTSSSAIHPASHARPPLPANMQDSMGTPTTTATPTTASLTPDTASGAGATASSSRRPSLRTTMTATLPRSALQEETIALFKQYRNLIPCAKCFCRNTIQRDGMSDGNLRFKCRPPVSMSLICNKSYSESKIRNMIAGVVYGHTLPDSGTPTSATGSGPGSAPNVLALAPPPMVKSGRRPSQKMDDLGLTPEKLQQMQDDQDMEQSLKHQEREQLRELGRENNREGHQQRHQQHDMDHDGYDDMGPGHGHLEDRRLSQEQIQGSSSRRASVQHHDGSPLLASTSHSGHLHVPGTPPMEGEDPRMYRPHSAYGHRSVTPTGPPSGRQLQKLHHSHSHPNIGQQRHQQYLEQQEQMREHRGSVSGASYSYQSQQQQTRHLQRQVVRRESAQYHGSVPGRPEPERRFSHPSALQGAPPGPSPQSSKYLPVGPMADAHSPALSSSSRSSPGRDTFHSSAGPSNGSLPPQLNGDQPGTPVHRSLPGGRYEEGSSSPYNQRRMSQPHPTHQRSGGQFYGHHHQPGLPPPPPTSSHHYDRRASEAEEYHYLHREKYEKLNASTLMASGSSRHPKIKVLSQAHSPHMSLQSQSRPGSVSLGGSGPMESSQHPLDHHPEHEGSPPLTRDSVMTVKTPHGNASPLMNNGASSLRTPQSEPMRFSHSMPVNSAGRHAYQATPHHQGLRHQQSSSSIYYQQPRRDDMDMADPYAPDSPQSQNDLSPEDADGRPLARMRQGLKRKSLGQSISRTSSNQNLYGTSLQSKDLNAALPKNTIKLTCFPNGAGSAATAFNANTQPYSSSLTGPNGVTTTLSNTTVGATTTHLDSSEALAMQLSQSSKIVIEISQPRLLQSYRADKTLHRTTSQPNFLTRSANSVLGCRRSASPDRMSFGSSKKRRADSLSGAREEESGPRMASSASAPSGLSTTSASTAAAEAAAAAVVAAAASAAAASNNTSSGSSGPGLQLIGLDYLAKSEAAAAAVAAGAAAAAAGASLGNNKEGLGLGLGLGGSNTRSLLPSGARHLQLPASENHHVQGSGLSSPAIEALGVAKASSYVLLEDQKELGIDYSLFTRVETAGWRILIPPNVVASFRSEDFGLTLKPKEEEDIQEPAIGHEGATEEKAAEDEETLDGRGPAKQARVNLSVEKQEEIAVHGQEGKDEDQEMKDNSEDQQQGQEGGEVGQEETTVVQEEHQPQEDGPEEVSSFMTKDECPAVVAVAEEYVKTLSAPLEQKQDLGKAGNEVAMATEEEMDELEED